MVKILKFGWNPEILLKSWNFVEILKHVWNPRIWSKSWNLVAFPNCLGLPYWYDQLELGWHIHQPETHQFSQPKWLTQLETPGPIDRTPGIPGSDKKKWQPWCDFFYIHKLFGFQTTHKPCITEQGALKNSCLPFKFLIQFFSLYKVSVHAELSFPVSAVLFN